MIVCLRIGAFAAAVEQRDNPHLEGRPLALVDIERGRQIVGGASPEALRCGVQIGMPLRQAQALCAELEVAVPNPARARGASDDLLETLATFSPLAERAETGPASGRVRRPRPVFGQEDGAAVWLVNPGRLRRQQGLDLARDIHQAVGERLGLEGAVGLASNRFTALVAAASLDPGQILLIPWGAERRFLAPFPVTLLPVYPEQVRQLDLLGIRSLGQFADLPAFVLADLFGRQGAGFKRLAEGRDSTPVQPHVPRVEERIAREIDPAVEDRQILHNIMAALADELGRRLAERGQTASELTLEITLGGGRRLPPMLTLRQPTSGAAHLAEALAEMLDGMQVNDAVASVEVRLSGIVRSQARQLSLFEPEATPREALRAVLRRLAARHGAETFFFADLVAPEARLAERRFRLRQAEAA